MSDILLAKPILQPGWIDCSVGEPHVVRECLFHSFNLSQYELPSVPHMYEYPTPIGYKPLIQILEEKHQAPVIITNGAKQALGATFYALKKIGWNWFSMRDPYWALIPPLAKMHNIKSICEGDPHVDDKTPFLLVAPNNPDGHTPPLESIIDTAAQYKDAKIPFIHDAAYYTHTYLPWSYPLDPIGDVQIYSISKMLGLSGLRLGYVVCRNPEFIKHIQEYMETMTVGVSIITQIFLNDLLTRMKYYPGLVQQFEGMSSFALQESKKIIQEIDPEILEVNSDIDTTPGMFGWFKVGPKADFDKSKINMIDGALFGKPGYIRMNLAFDSEKMKEIVTRLNSVKD